METIKLTKTPTGWNATFSDPKTAELFGTNTIATSFTAGAPASQVQREIQKLNPGCLVTVSDEMVRLDPNIFALAHDLLTNRG